MTGLPRGASPPTSDQEHRRCSRARGRRRRPRGRRRVRVQPPPQALPGCPRWPRDERGQLRARCGQLRARCGQGATGDARDARAKTRALRRASWQPARAPCRHPRGPGQASETRLGQRQARLPWARSVRGATGTSPRPAARPRAEGQGSSQTPGDGGPPQRPAGRHRAEIQRPTRPPRARWARNSAEGEGMPCVK